MTPIAFMALFEEFRAPSWNGWRSVLARLTPAIRELWVIAGRGGGKSRFVSLLACVFACREYRRAPGERIYVAVFAPDRKQARLTFRYVVGLLRSVPSLAALVEAETRESVELRNGVTVEVITAGRAAPRGRSYALVIVEEAAFLPCDERSAEPDVELLRAVRPALARVPGSLLAVVSSPYARRGVLYEASRAGDAEDRIVITADTLTLNPTFRRREVERAFETDPTAAASEYGRDGAIAFRSDVEGFVAAEAVKAVTAEGRRELPPVPDRAYVAFGDPAGGSGADSMTLAVAHAEPQDGETVAVLDAVREVRPPFSPESVVAEFAALLHSYRVSAVTGDRFGGEWCREPFRRHGVEYALSDRTKSEIYRDVLPLLNSGRCELLDHPRLRAQLGTLERRTARGGRDSIDHAPGGHDDVANAAAGALVLAQRVAAAPRELNIVGGHMGFGPEPERSIEELLRETDQWLREQGEDVDALIAGIDEEAS